MAPAFQVIDKGRSRRMPAAALVVRVVERQNRVILD